jgi:hypothetical protein
MLKVKGQLPREIAVPVKVISNGITHLPYSGLTCCQMDSRAKTKLFSGFERRLKLLVALQNLKDLQWHHRSSLDASRLSSM